MTFWDVLGGSDVFNADAGELGVDGRMTFWDVLGGSGIESRWDSHVEDGVEIARDSHVEDGVKVARVLSSSTELVTIRCNVFVIEGDSHVEDGVDGDAVSACGDPQNKSYMIGAS